ncbi:hypothetical protein V4C53_09530 [Paraburkholderia azotifigens]|uniref:hypothetical protein n=1 Tax=Paraburkholderia azotifigens TaxID=2057004 RepID=UPI00316ECF23
MLKWLIHRVSHRSTSPERLAEHALRELRLELYRAEQGIFDAHMRADYYRSRIVFCEEVLKKGIEQVSDVRRAYHEISPRLRSELKPSGGQPVVSSEPVATPPDPAVSRPVFAARGG